MEINETTLGRAIKEIGLGFTRASNILGGRERKKKPKVDEAMTLEQFHLLCSKDKQRHIRLIADWAKEKNPNCKTKFQWRQYIQENVKDAKDLSEFSDEQIAEGYAKVKKEKYERWTMRTVIKAITR